ncbi:asparagine synthase (glutamine-hydrolyzing) [Prochlorococcus marinus XMU1411]|uniref:asparagine synthase (glutamine-hydrolyzing) n=1 Tax=Prochlorococcus marinus TaxID=1219 RepID=UPI001ADCBC03|nr:asparagine synthase (glutamine-hydrolyzing) [Prochlorococcus marinus]MBO8244221.1 asparagine synthase (glutamine-hydrolyzing) [Prochlorococcus marinus XMU1411]MBW3055307.1 asparagine synthase (glutamine-hydrolyzing) [Prochlorococcus marinus str. MU1411]MCR8537049.1 asparagine synthase (glutamine-hydrolyzing) [Prochlorococcus marinus CUG1430]
MCGIVGLIGSQSGNWINEMNDAQYHRGPDEDGLYSDGDEISLAMRRLSIMDIEGGSQPLISNDRQYVLIYNGEIFNAFDLRFDLEKKGEIFNTNNSDTELLFKILQKEGIYSVRKLNGMFSFAFLDKVNNKLFLARDRFGIKPLYYTTQNGFFAFSSELKSILSLPFIKRDINMQSLFNYLSLSYVNGYDSIIEGIKRLNPGHILEYDLGRKELKIIRWWEPLFNPNNDLNINNISNEILDKLQSSIKRWTISDVDIGACLSGGLDSSAIVALSHKLGKSIKTFSLGFDDEYAKDLDELPLARKVALEFGTEHMEIILKPEDILEDLNSMISSIDEPYAGGLPTWFVFKFMSKYLKVGLTGTGGDELFGNYGKWCGLEKKLPWIYRTRSKYKITRKVFENKFFNKFYYFKNSDKISIIENMEKQFSNTSDYFYDLFLNSKASNIRDSIACTDWLTQLPDEFLLMNDRFSMAHSLEARTPFLDNELIDLILKIPSNLRTKQKDLKYLLRKTLSGILPDEILNAKKKGFILPIDRWLRTNLMGLTKEYLDPMRLKKEGIFNPDIYSRYVLPHFEGKSNNSIKIWTLLMFQLWKENNLR